MPERDYQQVADAITVFSDRTAAMQAVVDRLWESLAATGFSWIGFYVPKGPNDLVLGPRRDKPACSPIGLHGACGRAFLTRSALIVGDVRRLGANYVACDPRDLSELVIPLFDADGSCWGVFDLDSFECDAFSPADVSGLSRVLRKAGLTSRTDADPLPIVVV